MPETNFFWDPDEDNIIQERDETGAITAEYTTEPGLYGNLISQNRDGIESHYHFDPQGSTLALTDDNQQVTDTYGYSGFGEVTERTGSTVNSFQYVGQKQYYRDSKSGQFSIRRRSLPAEDGRWTSPDPLVGIASNSFPYTYVSNRPTYAIDPSGLQEGSRLGGVPEWCIKAMKERRQLYSSAATRPPLRKKDCCESADHCQSVTAFVALPHPCDVGSIGHSGVGFGSGEYFDFGPAVPFQPGVWLDAEPFWDDPQLAIWKALGKTNPDEIGMDDIIRAMRARKPPFDELKDYFAFTVCAPEKDASDALKVWKNRYANMSHLKYCVPGRHCTSTVAQTFSFGEKTWIGFSLLTPLEFAAQLSARKHTCGPKKGTLSAVSAVSWGPWHDFIVKEF